MITLRLNLDEINTLYTALDEVKDIITGVSPLMEKIKEQTEKDVESWDGFVTNEVNSVLEIFLPEAESGNVGIKYEKAQNWTDSGEQTEDPNKAQAVSINVVLKFTNPIDISNTK